MEREHSSRRCKIWGGQIAFRACCTTHRFLLQCGHVPWGQGDSRSLPLFSLFTVQWQPCHPVLLWREWPVSLPEKDAPSKVCALGCQWPCCVSSWRLLLLIMIGAWYSCRHFLRILFLFTWKNKRVKDTATHIHTREREDHDHSGRGGLGQR